MLSGFGLNKRNGYAGADVMHEAVLSECVGASMFLKFVVWLVLGLVCFLFVWWFCVCGVVFFVVVVMFYCCFFFSCV